MVKHFQHWRRTQQRLDFVKSLLLEFGPIEQHVFTCQGCEWLGNFRKFINKFSIVVCQAHKLLDLIYVGGCGPFLHGFDFALLNRYTVSRNDVPKEFDVFQEQSTLGFLDVQSMLS